MLLSCLYESSSKHFRNFWVWFTRYNCRESFFLWKFNNLIWVSWTGHSSWSSENMHDNILSFSASTIISTIANSNDWTSSWSMHLYIWCRWLDDFHFILRIVCSIFGMNQTINFADTSCKSLLHESSMIFSCYLLYSIIFFLWVIFFIRVQIGDWSIICQWLVWNLFEFCALGCSEQQGNNT